MEVLPKQTDAPKVRHSILMSEANSTIILQNRLQQQKVYFSSLKTLLHQLYSNNKMLHRQWGYWQCAKKVKAMKEETCIIIDFLPSGYADRRKAEPIAQAVGSSFFSLLELVPREGITLKPEQEVYIGEGKRDEIRFIRGQLEYRDLTNLAKNTLPDVVENIVKKNEARFIEFFNKAGMLTPRMHQFQLLPGIGKKHLIDILDERRKRPFESFADLKNRVKLMPDPEKAVIRRILQELESTEKHKLFVEG